MTPRAVCRAFLACCVAVFLAACPGEPPAASSAPVRFIALGDQGTGDAAQRAVAAGMRRVIEASGCDFILLLGDNFYPSGVSSVDDPQWTTKFEEVYGVFGLPVYAVLGNHDYGGGGGTIDGAAAPQLAYGGPSRTWHLPAPWYHFDTEVARFVALDTNWIKMHDDDLGQAAEVRSWLAEAAAAPTAPWRIVFGHHEWVSNGPHGNAGTYDGATAAAAPEANGARLAAFFEDAILPGADLYLCGHDHALEIFASRSTGLVQVLAGGGGGGLYELADTNPEPDADPLYLAQAHGFAYVTMDATELSIHICDENGGEIFTTNRSR